MGDNAGPIVSHFEFASDLYIPQAWGLSTFAQRANSPSATVDDGNKGAVCCLCGPVATPQVLFTGEHCWAVAGRSWRSVPTQIRTALGSLDPSTQLVCFLQCLDFLKPCACIAFSFLKGQQLLTVEQ